MKVRSTQTGFGMIAAITVLVILAVLSAAIVALSSTQSIVQAQDALSARADQTARAGTEWGLFQAFSDAGVWSKGASTTERCSTALPGAPVSATVNTSGINGFQATVTCWSRTYQEGEDVNGTAVLVRIYQVTSIACPAAPCPQTGAATAAHGYVERRREAVGM